MGMPRKRYIKIIIITTFINSTNYKTIKLYKKMRCQSITVEIRRDTYLNAWQTTQQTDWVFATQQVNCSKLFRLRNFGCQWTSVFLKHGGRLWWQTAAVVAWRSGHWSTKLSQVWWCQTLEILVDQHGSFEDNSQADRKPKQITQHRFDVVKFPSVGV